MSKYFQVQVFEEREMIAASTGAPQKFEAEYVDAIEAESFMNAQALYVGRNVTAIKEITKECHDFLKGTLDIPIREKQKATQDAVRI